ncbi:MAG: radical SAM family heme chaperone HemW [Peptococcaceae bacterium]|nr:radical SAM family heme chaperone HemW [Peptococcaceae bacterium]
MPSLYVHVPFCVKKCDYCAFYSLPLLNSCEGLADYLRGVAQEIELRSNEAPAGVSSLYLGGGTPTVLSWRQLDDLLKEIHLHFTFLSGQGKEGQSFPEKTTEANPGTITEEKLKVLRDYGVNRISLGAQSFNDRLLYQIGRIHRAQDILHAVKRIRKAGIENLNLDLIFGLPGQTLEDWQDTLRKAVGLSPEHLSVYALTLEEDTPLGKKYLARDLNSFKMSDRDEAGDLPDDDLQADMYEWAVDFLSNKGFRRYEISNFARSGYECQHNLAYWRCEEYIGLGPGAVSCMRRVRSKNIEDMEAYLKDAAAGKRPFDGAETEFLTPEQQMSEYMMLGLRTEQGIDPIDFYHKFQVSIQDIYGQIMANYIDRDVLSISGGRLKIHPNYSFVANSIIKDFIR